MSVAVDTNFCGVHFSVGMGSVGGMRLLGQVVSDGVPLFLHGSQSATDTHMSTSTLGKTGRTLTNRSDCLTYVNVLLANK